MNLDEELKNHFSIRTQCIWIDTFEEWSAIQNIYSAIKDIANTQGFEYDIVEWSEALGGFTMNPDTFTPCINASLDEEENDLNFNDSGMDGDITELSRIPASANALFDVINAVQNKKIKNPYARFFIIKELPELTNNDKLKRYIRDLKERPMKNKIYTPIIIISTNCNIPYNLQKLFVTLRHPIPTADYIENLVIPRFADINGLEMTDDDKASIAQAAAGLSTTEIARAFQMSYHLHKKLDVSSISTEKINTIQKSGILTYKIPKITLDDIGGHTDLKNWIVEAKKTLSKNAKAFGIKPAKGFLATGIAGCGKTAIAEAIANYFQVPFVRLDLSKIMGGIVGESERNARMAFEVLDSIGKTVVLIDEAEKALGGIKSSNKSDGGTMARVFGVILDHMNENKDQFYILTSNNVVDLPPELSRSGRLDSKWFFDFPSESERKDIYRIHFGKAGKDIDDNLLNFAAENSPHFTGAEIENAVNNILISAYINMTDNNGDGNITEKDIMNGIKKITTVYSTSNAEIKNMISYAKANKIPSTSSVKNVIISNSDKKTNKSNSSSATDNFLANMF